MPSNLELMREFAEAFVDLDFRRTRDVLDDAGDPTHDAALAAARTSVT